MALGGIDINKTILSFYETAKSLNTMVSDAVGIDAMWMRSIPHEKSEDVVFHEYTLLDVDCPKKVRVVTTNSGYNPGNFNIDLFGINYEAPFEVEIDRTTWMGVYGEDVMPQKGDIVYIELLNCLYEVATSTIIYGFVERETGYKVQLVKYNPKANRRENESVRETIDDLTVGVDKLFGEDISNEIADIVDDPQTSQMVNADPMSKDEYKQEDLGCIVIGDVSTYNNVVARSYYDLSSMDQSIIYKNGDHVSTSDRDYNRLFTCWINIQDVDAFADAGNLTQQSEKNVFLLNDFDYTDSIKKGDKVELIRGSFLHLNGYVSKIVEVVGKKRYLVTLNNAEYRAAAKKMTNFWNGKMKIKKCNVKPLLMGRTQGDCNFNISLIGNKAAYIKFGSKEKEVILNKEIPFNQWVGFACNLGPSSDVFVFAEDQSKNISVADHVIVGDLANDFEVGKFYITQSNLYLTNIRYYKTASQVPSSTIEKDLSTILVKNDSKTIVNDSAIVPNQSPYISQQR